jgi:iron complex transport system permease protein
VSPVGSTTSSGRRGGAPRLLKRPVFALALYGAAFVAAGVACPFVGGEPLDYGAVFSASGAGSPDAEIFLRQRIPRVLMGLLVGGSLAVAGAAFQAVLRNPLAEPFTLGVSGGCAVGAALAIAVPWLRVTWGPFSPVQILALAGAAGALGLICWIARRPEGISTTTVLLAGVTVSVLSAGAIMLMRYLASAHLLVQMDRWMMGGLDVVGYRELAALAPLALPGLGLLALQVNALNHISLGEEMAAGHGVDVRAVQTEALVGGGLATAAVVSVAGPISFVGLIVPHAVRRLSGYDHRLVLPASFLLGGAVLAVCDTAARTVMFPTEIPVGVVTALIGGPLFIRLLVKSGR